MKTVFTLASAFLSLIVLNPAYAADAAEEPRSLTVQFADIDLSEPEGAAALFERMNAAARRVCTAARSAGLTLREKGEYAACVEFALSNAVARVDRPVLTQYVLSRSSKRSQAPVQIASRR